MPYYPYAIIPLSYLFSITDPNPNLQPKPFPNPEPNLNSVELASFNKGFFYNFFY